MTPSEELVKAVHACREVMRDYLVQMINVQKELITSSQAVLTAANSNKQVADSFQFILQMSKTLKDVSQQLSFIHNSLNTLSNDVRERYQITDMNCLLREIEDLKKSFDNLSFYKIVPSKVKKKEKVVIFEGEKISVRTATVLGSLKIKDSNDLKKFTLRKFREHKDVKVSVFREVVRILNKNGIVLEE